MIFKVYIQFLLVILFFIPILTPAQDKNIDLISQIENGLLPMTIIVGEPTYNIEERMRFYKVPGVSITVVDNFEPVWTKHYGVMDSELNNPVTDATLFNVGSLSKGVASLTVLNLVGDNKIDLDEDVNSQLKSWKVPENKFTKVTKPTPRMLMNHSGGAMHHYALTYLRDDFPTITELLSGEPPAQERPTVIDRIPGTEFQYSNPGFAILQQLVIDRGKKPFHTVVKENIFNVLEMNHTTFEQPLSLILEKSACSGHRPTGEPIDVKRYYYPNAAAGGLWTTTYDYAKFVVELQKSYQGISNKVISQELAQEMISPGISKQYGLGVFMRGRDGEKYFGHMGDNAGFFAGYISHTTNGHGAIVFTNSQNGAQLIREITKSIAKAYEWKGYLPEEHQIVNIDEEIINRFCGRYKAGSDEVIEIIFTNGHLLIKGFEDDKLYHVGENKFVMKSRMGSISILMNESGKYDEIKYQFTDELGRFLYDEKTCPRIKNEEKIPKELLDEGRIDEAINAYRRIFYENKNDYYLTENRLNMMGYQYMYKKLYEQAIAILLLNTEFYPDSPNCYDSLGEAYLINGDKELAIENYKKVLQLNPESQNAKNKLEYLQNN
jgi:CubicO group peptidase (beta-lactamase class C family)